ncbi:hypothetical protein MLD38_007546 [Melastoma candidum]|uniref:Uncharacterized protein n=1 Tax=Melastoma candidum TaxID=119954 RepID=A0ACB9RR57_9MYRT|nr:hypothetical protein MLD38_007546 [Melastoma candidum]
MRVPNTSLLLLDLLSKARSLIPWVSSSVQSDTMSSHSFLGCRLCGQILESNPGTSYLLCCCTCGQNLCHTCCLGSVVVDFDGTNRLDSEGVVHIKQCRICAENRDASDLRKKISEKIHPDDIPDRQSPCFNVSGKIDNAVNNELIRSGHVAGFTDSCDNTGMDTDKIVILDSVASVSARLLPVSIHYTPSRYRSAEEQALDSGKQSHSPLSECCNETPNNCPHRFSSNYECYGCMSEGSTPLHSPSRINFSLNRGGNNVQQEQDASPLSPDSPLDQGNMTVSRPDIETDEAGNSECCSEDLSLYNRQSENSRVPLDFEKTGIMWFPPPPNDDDDVGDSCYFACDDNDDEMGYSGSVLSSGCSLSSILSVKERQHDRDHEPLRAMIQAHFRALVSQLFHGEGIDVGNDDKTNEWIDIVANISWQAANFVRPDTSRGGSMDPCDYVKVKCVSSGSPAESNYIKGIVCTKNVKHKRMNSQYKNPRILILGGALEYQRSTNQLASFDTLLQQEIDHLKRITSKIEALQPNVLLVEKSVSSYAQEYLLAKDISVVLNVKRPLLDRISRCTGAVITPSTDNISFARLGHCELFRLERVTEEHDVTHDSTKKLSKTLMYFEGCPRRLGCTVILRGESHNVLKKIKQVVQYAVFAAYHLSLETSFLADEGATLPRISSNPSIALHERTTISCLTSKISPSGSMSNFKAIPDQTHGIENVEIVSDQAADGSPCVAVLSSVQNAVTNIPSSESTTADSLQLCEPKQLDERGHKVDLHYNDHEISVQENFSAVSPGSQKLDVSSLVAKSKLMEDHEVANDFLSATDSKQSILVSFSSRCVLKGIVCERSRLLRIKFYGSSDKPLGKYLRDDLFDQKSSCQSCEEPVESHVLCFTHQQGNVTVNVKCISPLKLPGDQDGKIWMWHRCLKCPPVNGVPPATHRVVMSDAAWGLSFGKFLELSFSNYAIANRLATCGHSLQKDCLRYYGFGNMVAFFRYSPIEILSVCLPPPVLLFNVHRQDWLQNEAAELRGGMQDLYHEIWDLLESMEQKCMFLAHELIDLSELRGFITELKDQFKMEKEDYNKVLGLFMANTTESSQHAQSSVDILKLNRIRRSLVIGSRLWDRRLYSINFLLERTSPKADKVESLHTQLKELRREQHWEDPCCSSDLESVDICFSSLWTDHELGTDLPSSGSGLTDYSVTASTNQGRPEESFTDEEASYSNLCTDFIPFHEINLSERIDSAWTGSDLIPSPSLGGIAVDNPRVSIALGGEKGRKFKRIMSPMRVHSFDSAMRLRERIQRGPNPSSQLSALGSFHATGDYRSMVRDPLSNYPLLFQGETNMLNCGVSSAASFISSAPLLSGGARFLLQETSQQEVVAVYDDEPTSMISYAINSKEYEDWISDRFKEIGVGLSHNESSKEGSISSSYGDLQSSGALELYLGCGSYGSGEVSSSLATLSTESVESPHLQISFKDDSMAASGGKMKFSVTCYFGKQFDALQRKCCPSKLDFLRSLCRCKRWNAQGGKSNVYFAKSLDERFIIKQVTKTELDSFVEFAPKYFKYLSDSLSSKSPTCLAKILGLYQVTSRNLKGGKETKIDLMVMENLFFQRSISRVYDLKGSSRARYNSDTSGKNNVLLDSNLVEALRTKPIFLGSKAKRSLERAIWNDTSFLAYVDVMDYSLLVGVDEVRKELVIGIIDYMRQYTWDKHLETWVKASGILGGLRNTSPTIVSPKQYKKRFRKAMTTYFLALPEWSP